VVWQAQQSAERSTTSATPITREPLSALCTAATSAGFLIEELIEPLPAETMRERFPEDYEQLSKEPGFLILRLLKPVRPSRSAPG
jgi:hypothetical protein